MNYNIYIYYMFYKPRGHFVPRDFKNTFDKLDTIKESIKNNIYK